jgi:16S rRNA (guanine(966)-N(2))-methyltransferase RsmD
VRLAVMNLLAPRLAGCRWLDLCCGSGVMACEALQRGAAAVVAVERDRRVAAVALANLQLVAGSLDPPAAVTVHRREALQWLGSATASRFDLIYCDPPYRAGLHGRLAEAVLKAGWLAPDGLMVWECGSDALPPVPAGWRVEQQRRYGGTILMLLQQEGHLIADLIADQCPGIHPIEPTLFVTPVNPQVGAQGDHPGDFTAPGAVDQQGIRQDWGPASAAEGSAAAVLVPGGHEQPHEGDGDQTQHDAAEERFDHGQQSGGYSGHNSPTAGASLATHRHQP